MKLFAAIIPIGPTKGNIYSLRETIDSCTKENFEIVLVHDDFEDGTKEVLDSVLQEHPNVRVIRGNYRSPGKARDAGLRVVQTEWFSFWDIDDSPEVESISRAIAEPGAQNANLIVGKFQIYDYESNQTFQWKYPQDKENQEAQIAINPGLWRFIFRSSIFQNVQFGDQSMGEDQLFLARAKINFNKAHISSELLYTYSVNLAGQLTSDRKRASELYSIIEKELPFVGKLKENKFANYLVIRQYLTLISRGYIWNLKALKVFIKASLGNGFHSIKFILFVIRNKNAGQR
jgi:glycosyltransferase involved in cell wall biosynthesis